MFEMFKELTARCGELESSETYVIEGFIVEDHALICILDKLMNREGSIVGFNNGV